MFQPIYKNKIITLHTNEEIPIKELEKKADNLIDFLQYHAKKNNWKGKILLCGSEQKSSLCIPLKLETGGRPKKYFYKPKHFKTTMEPHIHIMLLNASPNTTITDKINNYWISRNSDKTVKGARTTYFKNPNDVEGFRNYMKWQSSFWREKDLGL